MMPDGGRAGVTWRGRGDERAPCRMVPISLVNPHLQCGLCGGYLIDATTVTTCLHSFCRSCLVTHVKTSPQCPSCTSPIHTSPALCNVRPDKTLQDLVYKLVPGLYFDEIQRKKKFLEEKGLSYNSADRLAPPAPPYIRDETMSVTLQLYDKLDTVDGAKDPKFDKTGEIVDTRYIQCKSTVRLATIKKLIRFKFDLDMKQKLKMFSNNIALSEDIRLMDVAYVTSWSREAPLELDYVIYADEDDKEERLVALDRTFSSEFSPPLAPIAETPNLILSGKKRGRKRDSDDNDAMKEESTAGESVEMKCQNENLVSNVVDVANEQGTVGVTDARCIGDGICNDCDMRDSERIDHKVDEPLRDSERDVACDQIASPKKQCECKCSCNSLLKGNTFSTCDNSSKTNGESLVLEDGAIQDNTHDEPVNHINDVTYSNTEKQQQYSYSQNGIEEYESGVLNALPDADDSDNLRTYSNDGNLNVANRDENMPQSSNKGTQMNLQPHGGKFHPQPSHDNNDTEGQKPVQELAETSTPIVMQGSDVSDYMKYQHVAQSNGFIKTEAEQLIVRQGKKTTEHSKRHAFDGQASVNQKTIIIPSNAVVFTSQTNFVPPAGGAILIPTNGNMLVIPQKNIVWGRNPIGVVQAPCKTIRLAPSPISRIQQINCAPLSQQSNMTKPKQKITAAALISATINSPKQRPVRQTVPASKSTINQLLNSREHLSSNTLHMHSERYSESNIKIHTLPTAPQKLAMCTKKEIKVCHEEIQQETITTPLKSEQLQNNRNGTSSSHPLSPISGVIQKKPLHSETAPRKPLEEFGKLVPRCHSAPFEDNIAIDRQAAAALSEITRVVRGINDRGCSEHTNIVTQSELKSNPLKHMLTHNLSSQVTVGHDCSKQQWIESSRGVGFPPGNTSMQLKHSNIVISSSVANKQVLPVSGTPQHPSDQDIHRFVKDTHSIAHQPQMKKTINDIANKEHENPFEKVLSVSSVPTTSSNYLTQKSANMPIIKAHDALEYKSESTHVCESIKRPVCSALNPNTLMKRKFYTRDEQPQSSIPEKNSYQQNEHASNSQEPNAFQKPFQSAQEKDPLPNEAPISKIDLHLAKNIQEDVSTQTGSEEQNPDNGRSCQSKATVGTNTQEELTDSDAKPNVSSTTDTLEKAKCLVNAETQTDLASNGGVCSEQTVLTSGTLSVSEKAKEKVDKPCPSGSPVLVEAKQSTTINGFSKESQLLPIESDISTSSTRESQDRMPTLMDQNHTEQNKRPADSCEKRDVSEHRKVGVMKKAIGYNSSTKSSSKLISKAMKNLRKETHISSAKKRPLLGKMHEKPCMKQKAFKIKKDVYDFDSEDGDLNTDFTAHCHFVKRSVKDHKPMIKNERKEEKDTERQEYMNGNVIPVCTQSSSAVCNSSGCIASTPIELIKAGDQKSCTLFSKEIERTMACDVRFETRNDVAMNVNASYHSKNTVSESTNSLIEARLSETQLVKGHSETGHFKTLPHTSTEPPFPNSEIVDPNIYFPQRNPQQPFKLQYKQAIKDATDHIGISSISPLEDIHTNRKEISNPFKKPLERYHQKIALQTSQCHQDIKEEHVCDVEKSGKRLHPVGLKTEKIPKKRKKSHTNSKDPPSLVFKYIRNSNKLTPVIKEDVKISRNVTDGVGCTIPNNEIHEEVHLQEDSKISIDGALNQTSLQYDMESLDNGQDICNQSPLVQLATLAKGQMRLPVPSKIQPMTPQSSVPLKKRSKSMFHCNESLNVIKMPREERSDILEQTETRSIIGKTTDSSSDGFSASKATIAMQSSHISGPHTLPVPTMTTNQLSSADKTTISALICPASPKATSPTVAAKSPKLPAILPKPQNPRTTLYVARHVMPPQVSYQGLIMVNGTRQSTHSVHPTTMLQVPLTQDQTQNNNLHLEIDSPYQNPTGRDQVTSSAPAQKKEVTRTNQSNGFEPGKDMCQLPATYDNLTTYVKVNDPEKKSMADGGIQTSLKKQTPFANIIHIDQNCRNSTSDSDKAKAQLKAIEEAMAIRKRNKYT